MTRFNMPACPGRRGNRSVVEWVGTVVIHQRAGQRVARWGQSQSPSEQPSRAGRLLCPAVCLPPCLHPVVSSSPHGRPCRLPVLGGEETEAWRAAALWPELPRARVAAWAWVRTCSRSHAPRWGRFGQVWYWQAPPSTRLSRDNRAGHRPGEGRGAPGEDRPQGGELVCLGDGLQRGELRWGGSGWGALEDAGLALFV